MSSADGSLLLFWIPSNKTDESSRIPAHSGLTVEKATYPLAPDENTIKNWIYDVDDTNKIVTLRYYTGTYRAETDVIVYGSYPITGKSGVYTTRLASNSSGAYSSTAYMFNGYAQRKCQNIQKIAFSNRIDTSNVTNMAYMFYYCSSLTSLDVSNFNTSKVTDMHAMFADCSKLTTLDVSNFNTSNVIFTRMMFYNCNKLTTLTTSDTWVKNPSGCETWGMFDSCSLPYEQRGAFKYY